MLNSLLAAHSLRLSALPLPGVLRLLLLCHMYKQSLLPFGCLLPVFFVRRDLLFSGGENAKRFFILFVVPRFMSTFAFN